MPRKMTAQRGAKAKADRLFSLIVRSVGGCEWCDYVCPCVDAPRAHTTGCKLQCAHIRARRFSATRTDRRNAVCLCAGCHHYFTDHPYEWAEAVDEMQGAGVYAEMMEASEPVTKMDWPAEVERLEGVARDAGVL